MIEAAESLFLEQGYDATSLAAIVKRSGGSLATLYELFGNKQGLLRAIIELARRAGPLSRLWRRIARSPRRANCCAAMRIASTPMSPARRAIALKRIVITEALRDPDFARTLYEDIHLPSVRELAASCAQLDERRARPQIDDPMAAAGLFFAIVMSDAQLRMLVEGDTGLLDPAALDWRLAPFLSHFRID